MTELLERKIRLHAQRLYEQRGRGEGSALQDWVKAESQVLENSILGPLYRKTRTTSPQTELAESKQQFNTNHAPGSEACS